MAIIRIMFCHRKVFSILTVFVLFLTLPFFAKGVFANWYNDTVAPACNLSFYSQGATGNSFSLGTPVYIWVAGRDDMSLSSISLNRGTTSLTSEAITFTNIYNLVYPWDTGGETSGQEISFSATIVDSALNQTTCTGSATITTAPDCDIVTEAGECSATACGATGTRTVTYGNSSTGTRCTTVTDTITCTGTCAAASFPYPSCWVSSNSNEGGNISMETGESRSFQTNARGDDLHSTYLMRSNDNTAGSYTSLGGIRCSGNSCTYTYNDLSFSDPGTYYIICTARTTLTRICTGDPNMIAIGATSCGANSQMVVTVTGESVTPTISPWIQVTGDVHSNTRINAGGGP